MHAETQTHSAESRLSSQATSFRLPPVVDDAEIEKYLIDKYGGIWFFDAPCIKENINKLAYFELETSERHKTDKPYSNALEVIRSHTGTGEEVVEAVAAINTRVISNIEDLPNDCIRIAPKNSVVAQINQEHLTMLPGDTMEFTANVEFGPENARIAGPYTKEYEQSDDFRLPGCFDGVLKCKVGARVMLTANNKIGSIPKRTIRRSGRHFYVGTQRTHYQSEGSMREKAFNRA